MWIHGTNRTFSERLVAFACVEGIFFSSSFAIIFWLKSRGLMPGLAQSNEFIARDEGLHTQFACSLLQHLTDRPGHKITEVIVRAAVECETAFVNGKLPHFTYPSNAGCAILIFCASETLSKTVLGITIADMQTYVRFVADQLLQNLGYGPVFHANNPVRLARSLTLWRSD